MTNFNVRLTTVLPDRGATRAVSSIENGHDRPIARHNRAWWYLAIAGAALTLSGCVHLQQRTGDKAICLVDYKTGIASCEYDTMKACREALRNGCVCAVR